VRQLRGGFKRLIEEQIPGPSTGMFPRFRLEHNGLIGDA
jgi:hypothetical protein